MADQVGHHEPVIDQMIEVWASTVTACEQVEAPQWDVATDCPGWTVKDQLSHLIGIERMMLGDPPPPALTDVPRHVRNEFGALNESWVEARRPVPGVDVIAEFVDTTNRRIDALAAMTTEEFDRIGWSPIGEVPYRRFMETRIIDTWAHEQDIRRALDRPGGRNGSGEQVVLDRCESTMPFVVGKRVAPPDGSSVLFVVTGVLGRHALVAMESGRATLVPVSNGPPPEVTLTMDQDAFWRLAFGRADPAQVVADRQVEVDGDIALGYRILDSMTFMS